jgi:hypothetical protein
MYNFFYLSTFPQSKDFVEAGVRLAVHAHNFSFVKKKYSSKGGHIEVQCTSKYKILLDNNIKTNQLTKEHNSYP